MSIHDDLTAPALDLPDTVAGGPGSGIRPILSPEEELAAAMRDVGRARGMSHGFGIRPIDECVGFEIRRGFVGYLRVGVGVTHGPVCATYDGALDGALWLALRMRAAWVNG